MKFISHRGNINGKFENWENNPIYINSAMSLGYDVEIDVWYNNGYWLGHNEPQYKIDSSFLINDKLWCHAKNIAALSKMLKNNIHCFWHQEDKFTLTSNQFIWNSPKNLLYYNSICVMPELGHATNIKDTAGICSDYIEKYRNIYERSQTK